MVIVSYFLPQSEFRKWNNMSANKMSKLQDFIVEDLTNPCGRDVARRNHDLEQLMMDKNNDSPSVMHFFFSNLESDEERCVYRLFYYAAKHNRFDVVSCYNPTLQEKFGLDKRCVDLYPLLPAAFCGNRELIEKLLGAGCQADTEIKLYDPASIIDVAFTPMDMAIINDDVDIMQLLRSASKESVMSLLENVALIGNVNCFNVLIKEEPRSSEEMKTLYFLAARSNAIVLKELVKNGFSAIHESWGENCDVDKFDDFDSPLHAAVSDLYRIHRIGTDPSILDRMNFLLSKGVKCYVFNKRGMLPLNILLQEISLVEPYEPFHTDILQGINSLISAMEKERPEQELLLPRSAVVQIQYFFFVHLFYTVQNIRKPLHLAYAALSVKILKMLLVKGVDLVNDDQEVDNYDFNPDGPPPPMSRLMNRSGPSGSELNHPSLCYIVGRESAIPFILHWPFAGQLENMMMEFCNLLLVYGTKPDSSCFKFLIYILQHSQPKVMIQFVLNAISLMSADDVQGFREYVESFNYIHPRQLKMTIRTQNGNLEHCYFVDISLISSGFCKSLKEMCRCALYDSIRHRRMAAHVKSLPLPDALKEYLIFGCKLEESVTLPVTNILQELNLNG